MISDVLAEAVAEIDRYLTDPAFEGIYEGGMRARIERLRGDMAALQRVLDDPVPAVRATPDTWRRMRKSRVRGGMV